MKDYYHTFHIPVMGIGHSVDTPIRVAPLGITSVISLVDDILLEKIHKYYCEKYGLPYVKLPTKEEDGRAKRITAYLETVREIVRIKMEDIREQPFFEVNDKARYFDLLFDETPMKREYNKLLKMKAGSERNALAKDLTRSWQVKEKVILLLLFATGQNRPVLARLLRYHLASGCAFLLG